jgi:hypothetical protein
MNGDPGVSVLVLQDIAKSFLAVCAFRGVSLEVFPGEVHLLGPPHVFTKDDIDQFNF